MIESMELELELGLGFGLVGHGRVEWVSQSVTVAPTRLDSWP